MDIKDKETNKKKNSCRIETIKNILYFLALLSLLIIIPIHLVSIKEERDIRKVQANNNETFECIAGPEIAGDVKFFIVKDKETGVEYIIVGQRYNNDIVSIIPRLKGDEIKYGYYSE